MGGRSGWMSGRPASTLAASGTDGSTAGARSRRDVSGRLGRRHGNRALAGAEPQGAEHQRGEHGSRQHRRLRRASRRWRRLVLHGRGMRHVDRSRRSNGLARLAKRHGGRVRRPQPFRQSLAHPLRIVDRAHVAQAGQPHQPRVRQFARQPVEHLGRRRWRTLAAEQQHGHRQQAIRDNRHGVAEQRLELGAHLRHAQREPLLLARREAAPRAVAGPVVDEHFGRLMVPAGPRGHADRAPEARHVGGRGHAWPARPSAARSAPARTRSGS